MTNSIGDSIRGILSDLSGVEWPRLDRGVAIAYCGEAAGAAHFLYWGLRVVARVDDVVVGDCTTIASEILPYSESYRSLVIVSFDPADPGVSYAYDPAMLTGMDVYLVSPRLSPVLEARVDPVWSFELKSNAPLLEASLALLSWSLALSGDEVRSSRIHGELAGLHMIVGDLGEAYRGEVESLNEYSGKVFAVAASPMMFPALVSHILHDPYATAVPPWLLPRLPVRQTGIPLVFYYTSVEESFYKRLLFNLRSRRAVLEVKFNTDPLTAPLYGMILQGMVYKKMV